MTALVQRLVANSVSCAHHAGKIVREVLRKGNLGIVEKGVNDLQTEADRSVQKFIVKSLSSLFPEVSIIGEEGNLEDSKPVEKFEKHQFEEEILSFECPKGLKSVQEKDVVVWIDPMDGTAEYTQGFLEHVTVLIGVAVDGRAVGGVIHQPFFKQESGELGRTVWGIEGVGYGGVEPIPPPKTTEKLILTTTRSHSNAQVEAAIAALKPEEVLRVGGAGYKVLLLIEGKAHAYVFASPGSKRWDTCAPEAVLRTLGGVLTDTWGNSYSYVNSKDVVNSKGVLAAVSKQHHELCLSVLAQTVQHSSK